MKQTYILKKKPIPEDLKAADLKKRRLVEDVLGEMSDYKWDEYKKLSRIRPKN